VQIRLWTAKELVRKRNERAEFPLGMPLEEGSLAASLVHSRIQFDPV